MSLKRTTRELVGNSQYRRDRTAKPNRKKLADKIKSLRNSGKREAAKHVMP